MSGKAMGWVWDQDISRDEKFILLAYADHADHEGYNVYPAVATVAKKTGYSERSVQRATRKLEDGGYLIPDGKSEYQTNKWRIPIYGGDNMTPPTDGGSILRGANLSGGDKNDTEGVTKTTQRGDTAMAPEPLIKPLIKQKEEDNITTEPFGLLMDAFINESNIPAFGINPRDVEAGQRMVQAGVTEADVIRAVQVLQDKGYNMVGLASVEKTTYNEAGKRKNKGDKDRSSDAARSKYAEGWE